MSLRRVVSLMLLSLIALLLVTSGILYISPPGRVAYWSGWTLWGLSRTQWTNTHVNLGVLFLIGGALHIWYNWRPITFYLKNKSKRLVVLTGEFAVALALTLVLLIGTQLALPPFAWIPEGGEAFKDAAAVRYGEPPYGHAELSTLATFARRVALDVDEATQAMVAAGFTVRGEESTLEEIAAENGVTAQALYTTMQSGRTSDHPPLPLLPRPGTGKRQLSEFCTEFGLSEEQVVEVLAGQGITADPASTLKDIADRSDTTPGELYEVIRSGVEVRQ